jgi:hypothetical protein
MQCLQSLFGFTQVARVGDRIPLTIGQKLLQTHIDTDLFESRNVLNFAFCLYSELTEIPISTFDEAHALDLPRGKFLNALVFVADEAQASNLTTISEGDMFAARFQLPARLFVLDRAVIPLEARITLLAWLVGFAVVIETSNGEPRPISRGLTGL